MGRHVSQEERRRRIETEPIMKEYGFPAVSNRILLHLNLTTSEGEFFEDLLRDAFQGRAGDCSSSQWSHRINGSENLPEDVRSVYNGEEGLQKLTLTVEDTIFRQTPDITATFLSLQDLVNSAHNLSHDLRTKLRKRFETESYATAYSFMAWLIQLAITLPPVSRAQAANLAKQGSSPSPALKGQILSCDPPLPCKHFVGREAELAELDQRIQEDGKVFVTGIPGIGKNELLKKYAQEKKSDYTNILYFQYSGSLKKDIINMIFTDDCIGESEQSRLRRHEITLKQLGQDSLILIDHFDALPEDDPYLEQMLQWRCHIVFATPCRYDEESTLELSELSCAHLEEMAEKLCKDATPEHKYLETMIHLLHRHTYVVELACRLLKMRVVPPHQLLRKLRYAASIEIAEKIRLKRHGSTRKATYYTHIRLLFRLYQLSEAQQDIMRAMTMAPDSGLEIQSICQWLNLPHGNDVTMLMDLGHIQELDCHRISLHPMIREVAVEELKPSVSNCATLLNSLKQIATRHDLDFLNYRQAFAVAEASTHILIRDQPQKYLTFLMDVFDWADKYHDMDLMCTLEAEIQQIAESVHNLPANQIAQKLDQRAYLEMAQDVTKAIRTQKEALHILHPVRQEHPPLYTNILSNLAQMYVKLYDLPNALACIELCIATAKQHGLTRNLDYVNHRLIYADILTKIGKGAQGYHEALDVAEWVAGAFGSTCEVYARVQETLGHICVDRMMPSQAENHYVAAMEAYSNVFISEPRALHEKLSLFCHALQLCHGNITRLQAMGRKYLG